MDRWRDGMANFCRNVLSRCFCHRVIPGPCFCCCCYVEKGFPYIVQTVLNLASFCPISHTLGSQVCTTVAEADVITTHSEINRNH